jgi:single-stranded DNA-specific DHH superfamily exonuclease
MKDILNDVNATFGGHKNACGIEINEEDFEYFKQKLLELESKI